MGNLSLSMEDEHDGHDDGSLGSPSSPGMPADSYFDLSIFRDVLLLTRFGLERVSLAWSLYSRVAF